MPLINKMKYLKMFTYLTAFTIIQWCVLPASGLYAADSDYCEIREMSSKKSEQLFIEIAINLLNGKSRFVSLDNMVKILKDYNIVELQSKDIEPAKEIIFKEVAFRMLKQHYLPRIGDKIKVYKCQNEFLKDAGIHSVETDGLETVIRLPLEIAAVKDKEQLKTIQWQDLVMQISTVIEKLWLKRIGYATHASDDISDEKVLLEAVGLLRRKFIQGEEIEGHFKKGSPANKIVKAAEKKIESWLKEGIILEKDIPTLTEMMMQYIIHSDPGKVSYISRELKGLRDINSLKEALRYKILNTTENIKSYNPADYGAFAMLQSLLNEISTRFSLFSNYNTEHPATNMDFKESRQSA